MDEDYKEFIVADNELETATPVEETKEETKAVPTEEVTAEPTEQVETEKTETQRVSQRINEAKQQAKDEVIAEMGYEWDGKPITSEKQYKEAIASQAEQQRKATLTEQGIDPKLIDDAVENNPTVKQARQILNQQAQQEAQRLDLMDFTAEYPDVKLDQIKPETWDEVGQGKRLVDAYSKQENRELKAKLKVYDQNKSNKDKSPVSGVSTHGSEEVTSEDDFMKGFNSIH